jgi:hypothetical protein
MLLEWQEKPPPILPTGKLPNLFFVAIKCFPVRLFVKIVAFLSTISPLIFNYMENYGIDSVITRCLITAAILAGIPALILYIVTLAHAISLRKSVASEAPCQPDEAKGEWNTQKS